jgi:hypothetical protein
MNQNKIIQWKVSFNFNLTISDENMGWLIHRFLEPSSYAGIGLIIAAFEAIQSNGLNETTVCQLLTGLVAFFMPSKKIVDAPDDRPQFPKQPD